MSSENLQYGRVAAESARIVNVYGSAIQIVGIILGILIFACFLFNIYSLSLNPLARIILGILVGSLCMLPSIILGALYRMLSNYVLFRTH